MKEAVVSDSTCLIGLERVGELDILPALFPLILIPPEGKRKFRGKFEWLRPSNYGLFAKFKKNIKEVFNNIRLEYEIKFHQMTVDLFLLGC